MKKKAPKPMRGLYLRGSTWWGAYGQGGRMTRRPLSRDRAVAERMHEENHRQIERGDFEDQPRPERLTFDEWVSTYLDKKEAAGKRSIRCDRQQLGVLSEIFGPRFLDTITREEIEGHLDARRKAVSGATCNRTRALLRHFFNLAIHKGLIRTNPVAGTKRLPEALPRRKYVLSEEELQAIAAAAAPHLRTVLVVAIATGLRKGDALHLKWDQVDFRANTITLWQQKTAEPIEVPMVGWIREALLRLRASANGSPFVLTYKGRPISDCKGAWATALRKAGLAGRGFHLHDLRRTAASMLYRGGASIAEVQRFLGHKNPMTTTIYLGVTADQVARAIRILDTPGMRAMAEQAAPAENCTKTSQAPITVPQPAEDQRPN